MTNSAEEERIRQILDGASRLSIEQQECVLAVIKGMVFTHQLLVQPDAHGDVERKGEQNSGNE